MHRVKYRCKLHEHLLRVNGFAQRVDNLIDALVTELFRLFIHVLYQKLHLLPEKLFVLSRQHADEVHLELEQLAMVIVNILYHFDNDIFIEVYKICVEVFEEFYVPVDNNDARVSFIVLLHCRTQSCNLLFTTELVPQLVHNKVEIVFVLHDCKHQFEHERVYVVDEVLEACLRYENEDDLDDVRKVLLKHLLHEETLLPLHMLRLFRQLVGVGCNHVFRFLLPEIVVDLEMLDELSEPSQRQLGSVIAVICWVTRLTLEELSQPHDNVAIELKVA